MRKFLAVIILLLSLFVCSVSVFAADAVNLAGYGFATGDSYEGENSIPLAAVDGVVDRYRWRPVRSVKLNSETGLYVSTSGRTAWFQVEFEIPTEITYSKIYWSQERAAKDYYKFLFSDDGENWTEVSNFSVDRNNGTGTPEKPIIDTVSFDPVKAKFYRIEILAGETKAGLGSFYEFELYGDPSQYDYLKKEKKDDNKDDNANDNADTESKFTLRTIDYIAIGIGVASVLTAVIVVIRFSGKGDGKNA